jgi:hypothetical protein
MLDMRSGSRLLPTAARRRFIACVVRHFDWLAVRRVAVACISTRMVYRNELEALAARKAVLDREIAERTRERDEAARLIAQLSGVPELPRKRNALVLLALVTLFLSVAAFTMVLLHRSPDADYEELVVGEPLFPTTPVECQRVRLELWAEVESEQGGKPTDEDLARDRSIEEQVAGWNKLPDDRKVGQATICSAFHQNLRHGARDRIRARAKVLSRFVLGR